MAVGKNKRISKGKKGGKKKAVDPFAKKDWYNIKAPSIFNARTVGKKSLVTRTQGAKVRISFFMFISFPPVFTRVEHLSVRKRGSVGLPGLKMTQIHSLGGPRHQNQMSADGTSQFVDDAHVMSR